MANSKTAKNRAKRQKKKERSKKGGKESEKEIQVVEGEDGTRLDAPLKKRRLVNGKELVFRQPGEESDEDRDASPSLSPENREPRAVKDAPDKGIDIPPLVDLPTITIHEDE